MGRGHGIRYSEKGIEKLLGHFTPQASQGGKFKVTTTEGTMVFFAAGHNKLHRINPVVFEVLLELLKFQIQRRKAIFISFIQSSRHEKLSGPLL